MNEKVTLRLYRGASFAIFALCVALWLVVMTGCANRSAGVLVALTQQEFSIYQDNANAKVEQGEAARLELELMRVERDVENLFRSNALPPEDAAKKTIAAILKKVEESNVRKAVWRATDESGGAMIHLGLASVRKYHDQGITADDLIPFVDQGSSAAVDFIKANRAREEASKIKPEVGVTP